ncbi:PrpF domain-containing protein [Brevibacterium marinum]
MILRRSESEDIDVEFTFAQVGIEEAKVDWGSNCGNCSSVVGLYAIEQGWVARRNDVTEVRTFNTNTKQTIIQSIPTPDRQLPDHLTSIVPGTVFPGHSVQLGFLSPEGRTTGKLLPTGQAISRIATGDTIAEVSLIDAGAPLALIDAEKFGFPAESYDDWVDQVSAQLETIETIRRQAAVEMGLAHDPQDAERAIPKIGLVSRSTDESADLQILMLSMGRPHPAMPITGSVGVSVAAQTQGTVVANSLGSPSGHELRIRIPGGVLSTFIDDSSLGRTIGVHRTARTLAEASLPFATDQLQEAALSQSEEALECRT